MMFAVYSKNIYKNMRKKIEISNSSVISVPEINIVYNLAIRNDYSEVEIYFKKRIERFDIVFIAVMFLMNKKYGIKFTIDFDEIDDGRLFEVRQYMWHYSNIYSVDLRDVILGFKKIKELGVIDDVISGSFLPIIYISENTFEPFFEKNNKTLVSEKLENYKERCSKELILKKIGDKINDSYYRPVLNIYNLLKEHPPVYAFVFCMLFTKIEHGIKSVKHKDENYKQELVGLWEFTKKYIKGLYELAKNIIEHSEDKYGVITMRIYDEGVDENEKHAVGKIIESYVIDLGEKGIVRKLIEETLNKKNISKVYREDYDLLMGKYEMKDFISPSIKTKLSQQLYRDLAHYGLMRYYKLINSNYGVVVSSSNGKKGRDVYKSTEIYRDKVFQFGTAYYFQLPFKVELYKENSVLIESKEMQGSLSTVYSLTQIIDLSVVGNRDFENIRSFYDDKIMLDFDRGNKIYIRNRDDEVSYLRDFLLIKKLNNNDYVSINMRDVVLGPSSLLRILAHLSTNYIQAIIIYNLPYSLYESLIEDNESYLYDLCGDKENIPYWYEGKAVLIYTYIIDCEYTFADMLFGKNKEEFDLINYMISHTYPNTNSVVNKISCKEDSMDMRALSPYFYKSSLMPFDILLKGEGNGLMFYQNLKYLLDKDIKIESTEPKKNYVGKSEAVYAYINALDGYKIKNTHFKIGYKIHAGEFYYAKRLFQNSYYTGRIAMIIAKRVMSVVSNKNIKFTLVGYEMYSELLMGLVKKFLREYGYNQVNHVLAIDKGEYIDYLPKNLSINNHIVIIVPIASTGSTSEKIIKSTQKRIKDNKLNVMLVINVLRATDDDMKEISIVNNASAKLDDMIMLKSVWYDPANCILCYNEKYSMPIFGTDKSSLTPALIFDVPLIKKSDNDISVKFDDVVFDSSLLYRKERRNDESFLFSISIDLLIESNFENKAMAKKSKIGLKYRVVSKNSNNVAMSSYKYEIY